jgi:hypothetical protein
MSFNGDLYPSDDGLNITTKGSIHTSDGSTNTALAVSGNNGYVLAENSAVTDGIEWIVNAHSSVTPSSTTTFTNKSIDFGTNTMTSTLAQLDTALSTTGTADATTFLRGDNSWASAGAGDMLLGTAQNITATKTFNDSVQCYFGTDNDANIHHNGSDLYIYSGTGQIWIDQNMVMASGDNLSFQISTNLTLVSGAVTLSSNVINTATEGGASSDDFTTCDATATGKSGSLITILAQSASNTVNIIDTSGAIQFLGAGDFSLDNSQDIIMFSAIAGYTHNYEVSRSDNAT